VNCHGVQKRLGVYQDGSLDRIEQREVEDHLVSCVSCRELKEEMDLALEFLQHAPAVDLPPDLVSSILDETVRSQPPAVGLALAGAGRWGWLRPILQPLVEPRFAMSMAMSLLSFSLLTWAGQKTFDRWQDADPMAHVVTATTGLDRAWERGVEVYRWIVGSETSPPPAAPGENNMDPVQGQ